MNENPAAERLGDALQRGMDLVERLRRERNGAVAERDRAVAERDRMMSLLITDHGESAGSLRYRVTCPVRVGFMETRFRPSRDEALAAFREAWGLDAIGAEARNPHGEE